MRTRTATVRSISILVLAIALFASGCGARLTKEQVAAVSQRGTGATGAAASGGSKTAATRLPTSGGGAATSGGTATGGGATSGGGTSADNGGGAGDTGAAAACTATPGSTDPGVSDTEIKLGNVSTISGPVPNFGATGVGGAKAYLNYINQTQGGVCGRKLTLVTADDRLDAAQSRSAAETLSSQVLGFVGNTTVVDGGLASVLQGTNIASTSLAVGDASVQSPNVFSPEPIDPNSAAAGIAPILSYFKQTRGITKVAIIYPAQADARTRALGFQADIQQAGLTVDGPYEVAIAETNYAGVVSKMKTDGADAFVTALEVNGMARLAQSVQQLEFKPKAAYYGAQAYGHEFIDLAGSAAEGTSIGIAYASFEDAATVPAMAAFVDWYARTNPGLQPDFFGIMGWAAADMMVQALQAAGGAPTRDKVLAALQTFHTFDAHGVMSQCDPPAKHGPTGFQIVVVSGGAWKREYPASGFATS